MDYYVGDAVVLWSAHWTPDRKVQVRAQPRSQGLSSWSPPGGGKKRDPGNEVGSSPGWVIVLCSWARHYTLTVPLSTQEYKWVPVNCQGNLTKCWEVTCDGLY